MKDRDQAIFFLGMTGVVLLVAVSLYIKCPTSTQERTLTYALGLMSALVATRIPGVIDLNIKSEFILPIRASGAIVIFLVIVLVKPAAIASTSTEKQFSNASCQGAAPFGKGIERSRLPSDLNPEQKRLGPEDSFKRPVEFTYDYRFGEHAGLREWTQVKPGVWVEMYPGGDFFSIFREVEQGELFSCHGTIVQRNDNTRMQLFIPDKGCDNQLWFKPDQGEWLYLGKMQSVM